MTDDAAAAGDPVAKATGDPVSRAAGDPVAELDDSAWALAAVIATYREAAGSSLAEALAADPDRTAVLALALAREFPQARVTGIDILARAIGLARAELRQAGPLAERVEVRQQDVAGLREPAGEPAAG